MPRHPSLSGVCAICGAELKKSTAAKHLAACLSKTTGNTGYIIVQAEGQGYAGNYWLHAAVPGECTLKDLDSFLRRTWLECCGHMSAFRNGRMEISRSVRISSFDEGEKLIHEYDYGDTTELVVTFGVAVTVGKLPGREKIKLIARNNPPAICCDTCSKPAKYICPVCAYDGDGYLCAACVEQHECGEEMLLPITNSPRCGVCGYEG